MLAKDKNTKLNENREDQNESKGGVKTGTFAKDGVALAQLRNAVKGRVIAPGDDGYDESRTIFYGGFDKQPALVVRPVEAGDVARAIELARETGMEVAVRSGGHSSAGHSVSDGGIVIDLRDMRKLEIDEQNRTAWAETGLTAGDVTEAVVNKGLVIGFGDTRSVGIGGITLGGGVGFLVRKYGMTIDNLLAAEIVTADGKLRRVDAQNEPDLFWAIRGGGGNFGVVTRFQYRLQPIGQVLGGMLFLPATPEVIAGFVEAAEAAPEELSTILNVMPAPPMPMIPADRHGKLILMAMMVYAGDVEAGQKAVAPFRALAKPIADLLRPMSYSEMFPKENGGGDYHPTATGRTLFLDQFNVGKAQTIIDYLQKSDAVMRVTQLRVLGGAMARVPADATAFAHRGRKIMAGLYSFYTGPEDKRVREKWVADFSSALQPANPGGYVNFMGEEGEARVREAYPGATWDRLAAVKARYDPTNLFHLNQNVSPAGNA